MVCSFAVPCPNPIITIEYNLNKSDMHAGCTHPLILLSLAGQTFKGGEERQVTNATIP